MSGISGSGLNWIRDLMVGQSTAQLTKGGVGISGSSFSQSDIGLFGSETDIDVIDATTGWNNSGDGDPVVLNTSTGEAQENGSCINIPITFSLGSALFDKAIGSFDIANKRAYLWYYISDKSAIDNHGSSIQLHFGTGGFTNSSFFNFAHTTLSNGWNSLEVDFDFPDGTTGTGVTGSNVNNLRLTVYDSANITGNNQRMDHIRMLGSDNLGILDSQNTLVITTSDKAIKTTYNLSTTESNGYNLREYGENNGTILVSRLNMNTIGKTNNTELQVDSFYFID